MIDGEEEPVATTEGFGATDWTGGAGGYPAVAGGEWSQGPAEASGWGDASGGTDWGAADTKPIESTW